MGAMARRAVRRNWDPLQHPRNPNNGKFVRKGSPEAYVWASRVDVQLAARGETTLAQRRQTEARERAARIRGDRPTADRAGWADLVGQQMAPKPVDNSTDKRGIMRGSGGDPRRQTPGDKMPRQTATGTEIFDENDWRAAVRKQLRARGLDPRTVERQTRGGFSPDFPRHYDDPAGYADTLAERQTNNDTPPPANTINSFKGPHSFLSNFHPSPITYEGIQYPTVEHAFQAAKTLDQDRRLEIANAPTPGSAKSKGRKVPLRPGWDEMRVDVMRQLLTIKFQDPQLRQQLLTTGDAHLEEGNTWNDRFWGTSKGTGANHLGKLLMELRRTKPSRSKTPSTPPKPAGLPSNARAVKNTDGETIGYSVKRETFVHVRGRVGNISVGQRKQNVWDLYGPDGKKIDKVYASSDVQHALERRQPPNTGRRIVGGVTAPSNDTPSTGAVSRSGNRWKATGPQGFSRFFDDAESAKQFAAGRTPTPPKPDNSWIDRRTGQPITNPSQIAIVRGDAVLARVVPIAQNIRNTIGNLEAGPTGYVGLAALRDAMPDIPRDDLDHALRLLVREPGVSIIPVANRRALTQRDRDAAVRIGGEPNHAIRIRPDLA